MMTEHKAPGKAYRKGITLVEMMRMFPDNKTAEAWYVKRRWPDGPTCPACGSHNVQTGAKHKTMPYRCREKGCYQRFSAKTGTVMEGSKIGFQKWMLAAFLLTTSLKSVSSMKLHRDLGVTQKTAWFMGQRLRAAFETNGPNVLFPGPVEADETYFGGLRKNMHAKKRKTLEGRGTVGKTAVVGVKDRETKQVRAKVVRSTDGETLQAFVREHVEPGATVYTDDTGAYSGLTEYERGTVKHSVGEYVDGKIHTNGIESLWSMLKRSHKGTFHKLSPKQLQRYVDEFGWRQNVREFDTAEQLDRLAEDMEGKRLRYRDLIADNGLPSGAREAATA